MYKTHTQTQRTKRLFRPVCLHRMLSSGFTPGTGTRSSQPPRVTHSPPMEHKTQQGKQPRQEIHPLPEEQEAPFCCFPPASRDLGRSQGWLWATSPAQLGAGESRGAALATRFPFLRKKRHQKKRNISLFHLENPSVWWLGKVLLEARGRGGERMPWVVSCQTPQVTLLARPAFIYFTAAELVVFRFLSPQSF